MAEPAAAGAFAAFFKAMHDLHLRAGQPSFRELERQAKKIRRPLSHTTARAALKGPRLPRYQHVKTIVDLLNGDQEHFYQLWVAAAEASQGTPVPGGLYNPVEAPPVKPVDPGVPGVAPEMPARVGEPRPHPPALPATAEKGTVARRDPFWDTDLDIASAAPVMQLLAAAVRDGRDINRLMLDIAVHDPRQAAPAVAFIAGYDPSTAAKIVAMASQGRDRITMLLSDLICDLRRTGMSASAARDSAAKGGVVVALLLDEHDTSPARLVRLAVLLCQPPLTDHRSLALRILTDALHKDSADTVASIMGEIAHPGATAVALEAMFADPGARHKAAELLSWLAKKTPELAVPAFLSVVLDGARLRRTYGRRTLLSIIAAHYRPWSSLLSAAVLTADSHTDPRPTPTVLAHLLMDLSGDNPDFAGDLASALSKRSVGTTVSVLSMLGEYDPELAGAVVLMMARKHADLAAQTFAAWMRRRHPNVDAPAGVAISSMVAIDPRSAAALLAEATEYVNVTRRRGEAFPRLAGLRPGELKHLRQALSTHASRTQQQWISLLLSAID
jgi:hypothetical protein